ncbi:MAG: hypothetical protein DMD91_30890 [Candidatus Rokuibacteriota bacterium]|nr:MAG: hypothetical protein DMD91_30890 [Candidatus Rokubacteria bacterium]
MKRPLWLGVLLVATGCTTIDLDRVYTKPQGSVVQTSWDEWQCRREVEDSARTPDLIVGGAADAVRIAIEAEARDLRLGRCMEARGYQASRQGGWPGFVRDRSRRLGL